MIIGMRTGNTSLMTDGDVFTQALECHRAGDLVEAERLYRQVLWTDPGFHPALHGIGVIALQRGAADVALVYFQTAARLEPTIAAYHGNLGLALRNLGRHDEAEICLRLGVALSGGAADACVNLANALFDGRNISEARELYERALASEPTRLEALNGLGNALTQLQHFEEAEGYYRDAMRVNPKAPEAYNNLGNLLFRWHRFAEAADMFAQALSLDPNYAHAHNNMGNALQELGRFEEAEASYRTALSLNPRYARAMFNLGALLSHLDRLEESRLCTEQATILAPTDWEVFGTLGNTHLLSGRFDQGWQHLRYGARGKIGRLYNETEWKGEPTGASRLLIHAEEGIGDTIQFCRFLAQIPTGTRIVLAVQEPLVPLMACLTNVELIVTAGRLIPKFDLQCSLLDLPLVFKTSLATIPADVPYLSAPADRIEAWRSRVEALPGLRVGLVWAGNPEYGADRRRSIQLDLLMPILQTPGVSFVSLQVGAAAAQAASLPQPVALHDWSTELTDFAETAALIETLDLVIGVDTAVIHLAGALAKPVWLLNRSDTCWRWMLNRDDSPWYPTLRLFRQRRHGDWQQPIEEMATALRHRIAEKSG
jgi:tetratricopeptide (TPR) repeat protein